MPDVLDGVGAGNVPTSVWIDDSDGNVSCALGSC